MHRANRPARLAALAVAGAGSVILATAWGWAVFAVFVAVGLGGLMSDGRMLRSRWPEFWFLGGSVWTMAGIGLVAAMTGGPHSGALPWLLIPSVGAVAVLGARGVVVIFAFGAATAVAASMLWGDSEPPNSEILFSTIALMLTVGMYVNTLIRTEARMRRGSVLDPLTGLLNRSTLEQRFEELREQALLGAQPIALVIFDLDHFKAIDDEHGHDTGDRVLRDVARIVRVSLRSFELAYRLGGEEFLVLLPGLDEAGAAQRAEEVRVALLATRPAGLRVTLSAGVASGHTREALDFERLYELADRNLYTAKDRGRNRVVPPAVGGDPAVRRAG
ncbi:unannotated protein [freshwater metagenome]|uniref:Unannotated protein n=1 Tax=freshwater metagenome TaxID=449393 RepID=A0A6J7JH14_9ZZZZ